MSTPIIQILGLPGGSDDSPSKLYHHSILFALDVTYDDDGNPSTYNYFAGHISVYRTNDTPITSLSQLTDGEIESAKILSVYINEAGDQIVPTQRLEVNRNGSYPVINVFYYIWFDVSNSDSVLYYENSISTRFSEIVICDDVVTEV